MTRTKLQVAALLAAIAFAGYGVVVSAEAPKRDGGKSGDARKNDERKDSDDTRKDEARKNDSDDTRKGDTDNPTLLKSESDGLRRKALNPGHAPNRNAVGTS